MHTAQTNRHVLSGGRYPVLRTLGILYLIGAAVTALAGIAAVIWTLARAPAGWGDRINVSLGILAATVFGVLAMLVIAEVIKLFIDVEHNTRLAAMALAMRNEQPQQTIAPMPAGTVVPPTAPMTTAGIAPNRVAALLQSRDEETAEAALIRGH